MTGQDVQNCPLSRLLDVEQRQMAAGRLNAAVLANQQQEKRAWLADLLRQLVYSQARVVIIPNCLPLAYWTEWEGVPVLLLDMLFGIVVTESLLGNSDP